MIRVELEDGHVFYDMRSLDPLVIKYVSNFYIWGRLDGKEVHVPYDKIRKMEPGAIYVDDLSVIKYLKEGDDRGQYKG